MFQQFSTKIHPHQRHLLTFLNRVEQIQSFLSVYMYDPTCLGVCVFTFAIFMLAIVAKSIFNQSEHCHKNNFLRLTKLARHKKEENSIVN